MENSGFLTQVKIFTSVGLCAASSIDGDRGAYGVNASRGSTAAELHQRQINRSDRSAWGGAIAQKSVAHDWGGNGSILGMASDPRPLIN